MNRETGSAQHLAIPEQGNRHVDLPDKTSHQLNTPEQPCVKQSHLANPAGIPDP